MVVQLVVREALGGRGGRGDDSASGGAGSA